MQTAVVKESLTVVVVSSMAVSSTVHCTGLYLGWGWLQASSGWLVTARHSTSTRPRFTMTVSRSLARANRLGSLLLKATWRW